MIVPLRLPAVLRYRDCRLFAFGYFPAETGEYIYFVVQLARMGSSPNRHSIWSCLVFPSSRHASFFGPIGAVGLLAAAWGGVQPVSD